jgi:hypothetical protein
LRLGALNDIEKSNGFLERLIPRDRLRPVR